MGHLKDSYKAARAYMHKIDDNGVEMEFSWENVFDAFVDGAKWQRKQIRNKKPPEVLSPFAAVKGMDVPDSLMIGVKYTGRKRLTDEQFEKLLKHAKEFARSAVWGRARELECDSELRDYLQEYLIEPFIEPLINGEL